MPSTQDAPLVHVWLTQSSMSKKVLGKKNDSNLMIKTGPRDSLFSGNVVFGGRKAENTWEKSSDSWSAQSQPTQEICDIVFYNCHPVTTQLLKIGKLYFAYWFPEGDPYSILAGTSE